MTAGEHSGRGYGRDDQGYPSHPEQVGGADDVAGEPSSTSRPRPHPASSQDPHAYGDPPPSPWSAQQPWREQPSWRPDPYDNEGPHGEPGYGHADYGQAHTQAFQRPADGYLAADGYRGGDGAAGGEPEEWHAAHRESGRRREPATDGDGERGRRDSDGKRRGLPMWQELPLLLVIAFCLAILVRTFLLQAFFIPSGSMEDTLLAGDRVLVNKIVYNIREPARGEVVVFQGTDAWAPQHVVDEDIGTFAKVGRALGDLIGMAHPDEKDYIKRIIGLPGDRVSCCDVDGRIFVNGEPINEDYVTYNAPLTDSTDRSPDCRARRFEEVVVEPGQMFVLGDHRAVSQDSRCQGQVPIDNIVGRAFVIVWPTSRWTGLSAPDAFDRVPHAAGPEQVAVTEPGQPDDLAVVFPGLLLTTVVAVRLLRVRGASGIPEAVSSRRG